METASTDQRTRLLDPLDRISEVLFGLIMAVTIVGSLSIATAGPAEVRTVLIGGARLQHRVGPRRRGHVRPAHVTERPLGLGSAFARRAAAASPDRARVPDIRAMSARRARGMAALRAPGRRSLRRRDLVEASASSRWSCWRRFRWCCPSFSSRDTARAMAVSQAITLVMLFFAGHAFGRYAGHAHPMAPGRRDGGIRRAPDRRGEGARWLGHRLRLSRWRFASPRIRRGREVERRRHRLLLRDARRAGLRRRRRHARLRPPALRGPLQLRGDQRGLGVRRLEVLGRRGGHVRGHADRRRAVRRGARRDSRRRGERRVAAARRVRRSRVRRRQAAARVALFLLVDRDRVDAAASGCASASSASARTRSTPGASCSSARSRNSRCRSSPSACTPSIPIRARAT